MKKLFVLVLLSCSVLTCFGLTRQEKDFLANSYLARMTTDSEHAENQEAAVLDCSEIMLLLLSDVLLGRITSKEPNQNDLVDRCLSQCDTAVLQRIAWLQEHPHELDDFWRECWHALPVTIRVKVLQNAEVVQKKLASVVAAYNSLDTLVPLAKEWEESNESEELLATAKFSLLYTIITLAEDVETEIGEFDISTVVLNKRLHAILNAHYAYDVSGILQGFYSQFLHNPDDACLQLGVQGGVVVLALLSQHSIQACMRVLREVSSEAKKCM